MKLYEINEVYQNLVALLEDEETSAELLEVAFENIKDELHVKVENYARIIKNTQAEVEAYKEEVARMTAKRRSLENNIERMKEAAEYAMRLQGEKKVKGELFTLAIQKNPPSLKIDIEPEELPQEFQTITISPNKEKIKAAIKEGKAIEWARLEQGESLRIR